MNVKWKLMLQYAIFFAFQMQTLRFLLYLIQMNNFKSEIFVLANKKLTAIPQSRINNFILSTKYTDY